MASSRGKRLSLITAAVAVITLGGVGFALRSAILEEYYIWNLQYGDETIRTVAANRLARMTSLRAMPYLAKALAEAPDACPSYCMDSLESILRVGRPAVPVLSRMLASENGRVRGLAVEALLVIGVDAQAAIPELIQVLGDGNEILFTRLLASLTLRKMGPLARSAIPTLIGTLKEVNPSLWTSSVNTLAAMGPAAKAARPMLTLALASRNGHEGRLAAWALEEIGK